VNRFGVARQKNLDGVGKLVLALKELYVAYCQVSGANCTNMIPATAAVFSLEEILSLPAQAERWNGSPALRLVYYLAVGPIAVA
jgi:hypothetical protein